MTTIANTGLILDELAKRAGYMIFCEDQEYVRFWIKQNGDIVRPRDHEKEIYAWVNVWADDLAPQDRDHVLSMTGMARIEAYWNLL